jgi:ubiquinone/menaquinone biosynthesis C-methylase UbiE
VNRPLSFHSAMFCWCRMTRNKDVYRLPEVAAVYARQSTLFPPEKTILHLMLPELRTARMLDLGVGGGRTTLHFARCVREYVGADYSENMIHECNRRFATYPDAPSFVVCDARSMNMFAGGSFDFILFSLNGIDSVNHSDRLTILQEIRRVGKPGGWFCFSSHNLNFGAQLFELRQVIALNPKFAKRTAKRLVRRFVYNWRVPAATVRSSQYMMIRERAHSRRILTYYIRPEEQLSQLSEHFADVRVFSFANGSEIAGHSELQSVQDMCLYYLCRIGH